MFPSPTCLPGELLIGIKWLKNNCMFLFSVKLMLNVCQEFSYPSSEEVKTRVEEVRVILQWIDVSLNSPLCCGIKVWSVMLKIILCKKLSILWDRLLSNGSLSWKIRAFCMRSNTFGNVEKSSREKYLYCIWYSLVHRELPRWLLCKSPCVTLKTLWWLELLLARKLILERNTKHFSCFSYN